MQARNLNANGKNTINASHTERYRQDQESSVRLLTIPRAAPKIEDYGFCLTRSKWDPYPWVCEVAVGTPASLRGLKAGDCILKVNGVDILGMKIAEVAQIVKSQRDHVTILCWNSDNEFDCDENSISCVPMPTSLKRLVIIVDSILKAIECPVCNSNITPPVMQCQNGHVLCLECRIRTEKCPICRGFFTPIRSTIAEEIYSIIASAFKQCRREGKLRHKVFGNMTLIKAKTCDHCLTTANTKTSSGTLSKRIDIPINKFIGKIFQARDSSLENASQLHPIVTKKAILNSNEFRTTARDLPEKEDRDL